MITLDAYFTASGKYPDRAKSPEITLEVKANATRLLEKVNAFLKELGVKEASVSSGFRPSAANAATKNAAKASLHMSGRAIDISDPDNRLDDLIESKDDLKKKYGLWQESPGATAGWLHLDDRDRGKRPKNTFIP